MQRPTTKLAAKPPPAATGSREARARAVRAIVFMTRLFEYECRDLNVTMAQYRMLLYLRHGPKRAGELATRASVTRPALSALIGDLERLQFVARAPVQADGRGVELKITRRGLDTIERVEERFGSVFDETTLTLDRPGLLVSLGALCRQLTLDIEARVRTDDDLDARSRKDRA